MLQQLAKLAEVDSSEKRRELMSGIAELFMTNSDTVTDNETALFGDILTKLLDVMDEQGKLEISQDFSTSTNAPKNFAMALAQESAEVATPMLTNSTVYTDADLVQISENSDTDHRLAISSRETVSSVVTDSLIGFGENKVLQSIVVNKGAEISNDGLRKIVEHAQDDQTLATNLTQRKNIFDQLKTVLPTMTAKAQGQFSQLLASNSADELEQLMQSAGQEMAKDRLGKKVDSMQAKTEVASINNGKATKNDVIIKFAKADKPLKIATIFASFAKLEEKYVANSILQFNSDALVVLCKSADISIEAVREIGEMRCRILKTPSASVGKFVDDFENMDEEASSRTMRFVGMQTKLKG
ncbi:MAG: DUF2336 domain-containing protein [Hyphomicrobiales bacterium]